MSGVLVSNFFKRIATQISEKFKVDENKVLQTIEDYCKDVSLSSDAQQEPEVVDSKTKKSKSPTPKKVGDAKSSSKCEYVFSSGKKKGEDCTSSAKEEHEGKMYCGMHYKVVSKPPQQKVASTKTTKSSSKNASDTKSVEFISNHLSKITENTSRVIRRNKWGNYVDMNTNIVFDKESKKALGNQLDNGSIGSLTKDQISN